MSKKLEDFISKNKKAFDDYTPSEDLWQRIENRLNFEKEEPVKARVFAIKKWMQVAAILVLMATTAVVFYNLNRQGDQSPDSAIVSEINNNPMPSSDTENNIARQEPPITNDSPHAQLAGSGDKKEKLPLPQRNPEEDELYHYVKLIEIKQGQMEALKKSEPELYKEFSRDAEMLETSYDALKAQLSKGVNSEKLLEAMIGNLKMQADLLNKQLGILKQVHKKKNINDEKDYKNL